MTLGPPMPRIVAHRFRLFVSSPSRSSGIAPGPYRVAARVRDGGRTLAASIPVSLVLTAR
ncbi:MAG: hypothetical protein H0W68_11530 [Gemmatimonadaceae bacterium]|nr:hypothetical protein [Gemmatimonadaceae bacterium]